MRAFRLLAVVAACLAASPLASQATYPTPAGSRVAGVVPLTCDGSGQNCAPSSSSGGTPTGTAGSPNANVVTVQGISGGTPQPQSASDGAIVSLGATTDAACATGNGNCTLIALTKFLNTQTTGTYLTTSGGTALTTGLSSDASSATSTAIVIESRGKVFNGTTWDRQRGDLNGSYSVMSVSASTLVAATTTTTAAVASAQVGKASAGNLYAFQITTGATAGYAMVFNATSAPADGAVTPAKCYAVAANTTLDKTFQVPVSFSTGITVVFSTTGCFAKVASATAFISVDVK